MKMKRILGSALALAVACSGSTALADTFAPSSLIIPMDTSYQDAGMLKAYGLVYKLLSGGVPVRWVILQGKTFGGADFTASAKDHKTNAAITSHGYRGGPFVIDAPNAAAAIPIINAWQTANPSVAVHEATSVCRFPSPENGKACRGKGDCGGGWCLCTGDLARPNAAGDPALAPRDGTAATGVCSDAPMMSGTWWCLVEDGRAVLHGIIID